MSYGSGPKIPPAASVLGTMYAPQLDLEGGAGEIEDEADEYLGGERKKMGRGEEEQGVTLEYVQRLEDEIADKNKEIQLIKAKLTKDAKKATPHAVASPVCFLFVDTSHVDPEQKMH